MRSRANRIKHLRLYIPDIQTRFWEHVRLNKECQDLGALAIEAAQAGRKREAKRLEKEMKARLRRMMEIEGGRTYP
jgi:ribosomal protein L34E